MSTNAPLWKKVTIKVKPKHVETHEPSFTLGEKVEKRPRSKSLGNDFASSYPVRDDLIENAFIQIRNGNQVMSNMDDLLKSVSELVQTIDESNLVNVVQTIKSNLEKINVQLEVIVNENNETTSQHQRDNKKLLKTVQEIDQLLSRISVIKKVRTQITKQKKQLADHLDQSQDCLTGLPDILTSFVMSTIKYYSGDESKTDICDSKPLNRLPLVVSQWPHANKTKHSRPAHVNPPTFGFNPNGEINFTKSGSSAVKTKKNVIQINQRKKGRKLDQSSSDSDESDNPLSYSSGEENVL